MERDFKAQLLDVTDRFSEATGTAHRAIGREVAGDARFFERLLEGKSCTLDTATRILRWCAERWPENADWPADVPRPAPSEQKEEA